MPNEEYQSLFACRGAELRERFLASAADPAVRRFLDDYADEEIAPLVQTSAATTSGCCSTRTVPATRSPIGRAWCSPTR
jgi:pyruvate dehydrogenase complex dehydrogenase (E1) component